MRFAPIAALTWARRKRSTVNGQACELGHGALAIAAVTSCTTATDPSMMLTAGLVAKQGRRSGAEAQAVGEVHPGSGQPCHRAAA